MVYAAWYRLHHPEVTAWAKENEITMRIGKSVLRRLDDGTYRTTRIIVFGDFDDKLAFILRWEQ